jgi:excisionase family DNA binding protein
MPWVDNDLQDEDVAAGSAAGDRQPTPLPGLLFVSEVAVYLRKSERTIRRWIEAGHLPAVRLGPETYIREADLIGLIDVQVTASIGRRRVRRPGAKATI